MHSPLLVRAIFLSAIASTWLAGSATARAAQPEIDVRVHPRVGLFNEIQYRDAARRTPPLIKGQESNWHPLGPKDYLDQAFGPLPQLVRGKLGEDWEIVTTFEPKSAYATRRARVTVQLEANGSPITGCRTDGVADLVAPAVGVPSGLGCAIEIEIRANTAIRVPVSYRSANSGNAFVALTAQAQIPEDFLIVIAGDSYASGEGNPDRPCRQSVGVVTTFFGGAAWCADGPALWMDEQCHRSMWAAGMRAAMRVAATDADRRRGAYTILNLACSGARVDRGLVSGYEGIKTLETVRKNHSALGLNAPLAETAREVPAQLDVLNGLVGSESKRGGKAAADVLILSGGGNDLGFGDFVVASVKGISSRDWLEKVTRNLNDRLSAYSGTQKLFAEKLWGVPAALLVYVPYPDVTGLSQNEELALQCDDKAAVLLDGFAGGQFSIDSEERGLAYRVLIQELNSKNEKFAGDYRIRMLDREPIDALFKRRGWCAKAAGAGPYTTGERWIRKADESLAYQSGPNGTMHPTFEGHEALAGEIEKAIRESAKASIAISLADEFSDPASKRRFTRSPLRIVAASTESAGAPAPQEICKGDPDEKFSNCAVGAVELDYPHGAVVRPVVTAIHAQSRKRIRQQLDEHVVDAEKPVLSPCVARRGGGPAEQCGARWLVAGDVLEFRADDGKGTGLASLKVRNGNADMPSGALAADGTVALPVAQLPNGRLDLVAYAEDRVKNVGMLLTTVHVDTTPPKIAKISAYGVALEKNSARRIPAWGGKLDLMLEAVDAESGVLAGSYVTGGKGKPTLIASDTLIGRAGACATFTSTAFVYVQPVALGVEPAAPFAEFSVEDCARLRSDPWTVQLKYVRPREPAAAKTAAQWAATGVPAIRALFNDSVAEMTSVFSAIPDSADQAEFAVFSVWLNVADGRVDPGGAAGVTIGGDCSVAAVAPGQGQTLYAALRATEECAERLRFDFGKRAALMRQLAAFW